MRSDTPKVLHRILGRPLVCFPVDLASSLRASKVVAVLGHGADEVRLVLPDGVEVAIQDQQLGTADAVRTGLGALRDFNGDVLILSGDVPRLRADTVERLLATAGPVSLVVANALDPTGYGRIIRGADGRIVAVVEQRDCTPAQLSGREINAGIYRFSASFLREYLPKLTTTNAQGEYYLTDLIALAGPDRLSSVTAPLDEIAGINDRLELARAIDAIRLQVNAAHQKSGTTMTDAASVTIDFDVRLGRNIHLEPGCLLLGQTTVGDDCVIRANSMLEDAVVGAGCIVGPFARLRPKTVLADHVHLGNFVETKATRMGSGSKANHLSYLGDAVIGIGVNIGAGTITCNYDGEKKHTTHIGDHAFIGSDSQLVAPVSVGAGAYVAAGTTVVEDVESDALAMTRSPTVVKPGWAANLRAKRAKSVK